MLRTRIETLFLFWLLFLGGAVSADASEDVAPSRPIFSRDAGIAPPQRIPDARVATTQPRGTPVAVAGIPGSVRRAVVADAARRFNVARSAVVLSRAERVTWNDGSLGCAEPGMYYTQTPMPGYRIIANTAAGELAYHTDSRDLAKTCDGAARMTNRKSIDAPREPTPKLPSDD